MTDELKPCPFCGGKAEYAYNPFHGDESMARCVTCGASAFWSKWNQRATGASEGPADNAVFRLKRDATVSESKDNGTCIVYADDARAVLAELTALRERVAGIRMEALKEARHVVYMALSLNDAFNAIEALVDKEPK